MNRLKNILSSNKILFAISLFTIFYVLVFTVLLPQKSKYEVNTKNIKGRIIDYKIDGDYLNILVKAQEKIIVRYYFDTQKEKKFFENELRLGLELNVMGVLETPNSNSVPNTFNYQKYLKHQKIYYIMTANNIEITNEKIPIFYRLKNWIISRINKEKYGKEYYYTFLLGNKNFLNSDIIKSYRNNGVTHLFAISGMHISLFIIILNFVLKKMHFSTLTIQCIIIMFLIFYVYLTNFSASCLRCAMFYILLKINKFSNLKLSNFKLLIYTIIFLTIINPYLIYNIAFIYSCISTLAIILCAKRTTNKKYLLKLLLLSFYIILFTLPITLRSFYEFNLFSIFNNLIFVPLISFIIYPLALISFFLPLLNYPFYIIILFMQWLSKILECCSFNIVIGKIPIIVFIIYYILLYFCILKNKYINYIFIIILLIVVKLLPYFNSNAYVYFLDVGQGDSTVIRFPHTSKTILIDTGGLMNYPKESWQEKEKTYKLSDNTITFLKSLGINKLDFILITHGDYDHMGEAINLVNSFKVDKIIFNCGEYNDLEKELISVLDKKNIKYYSCIKELNIDKYNLEFLNTKEYDNENDNSNVIYIEIYGYKFMFMGDAGIDKEKDILDKYNITDIDVLKVGHHGSNTSSSKEFIYSINPKYSLISVGENNRYGHPKDEVLKVLKNSKIYRTDQDGSIMFKIKNNKLKIETCGP